MFYEKLIKTLDNQRIKLNEPLSLHTTIKIGGPADLYFEATSIEELIKAIKSASRLGIPVFVLGGGSNILVSDKGVRGLIIKNRASNIRILAVKGKISSQKKNIEKVLVEAESGATINQLVRFSIEESLSGLEYFLGQPGTVGGAIFINAHNMHQNKFLGDYVFQGKIFTSQGEIKTVPKEYFQFGYDQSNLQKTRDMLLSATFALSSGDKKALWRIAMEESSYRKKTQPPLPSLGCTFRNVPKSVAMRLATPNYTTSAGYLIDRCGLKGTRIGGAEISKEHANFIINKNAAKAQDVVQLIHLCKEKVKEKFNIDLKEEIIYLGEF